MAAFLKIVAVLVLLAGGYIAYTDFADLSAGAIGAVSYFGGLAFTVVLAGILWVWGGRAGTAGSNPSEDGGRQ